VKKHAIAALLAAAALTLASCGGNAGGAQGGGDMQGMDHGNMDHESMDHNGSGEGETKAAGETTGGGMAGMDHSNMGHGEMSSEEMAAMSREMVMPNGRYSDKAFIDAMVPHHEGAVEMAEVALERAEHPEIKKVAEDIISSQEAEIRAFRGIREREYGSAESTTEMDDMDMQAMGMSDPRELAKARPFDKAFIDDMIPHHESAIVMAEVARKETRNPQIRRIANDIVSAQEREIKQMKQWREEWYPEG
jgi:uncharacterized protein (DUF305 family)